MFRGRNYNGVRPLAVTIWNFTPLTPVGHVIQLLCSFLMERKLAVETLLQVAEPSVVLWLTVTIPFLNADLTKPRTKVVTVALTADHPALLD